jgi:hypothetical protein
LKTDKRGRVRTRPERRQELLDEFDKSGLSAPKFAAVTGLKYQTLAGWLHRRRKQKAEGAPALNRAKEQTVQWLETVLEKAQATQPAGIPALSVRLPSGATIDISNAAQAPLVGAVLRAWEKASC